MKIRKAEKVIGNNLFFKNATVDDAEFIFQLRTNSKKNQYLSATSDDIQDQINWMHRYSMTNDQAYFIIYDLSNNKIGVVRIYDCQNSSFRWGSWIMVDGLSPIFAIEVVLIVYSYGLALGFTDAFFEVSNQNTSVWKFHESIFGASLIDENNIERSYLMNEVAIKKVLSKLNRLLPNGIQIKYL